MFLTNEQHFKQHLEDEMTTLKTYPEARAALRGAILNAKFSAHAEEAKRTHLENIPAPMVYPHFIHPKNFNAVTRVELHDQQIAERIAFSITPDMFPDLDAIRPVHSEVEYRQAMTRFMLAGGAVASALALYGAQSTRGESAAWRCLDLQVWPPEAEAALEAAREEAKRMIPVWLGYMAFFHEFIPGLGGGRR